jgi:dimethylargininase
VTVLRHEGERLRRVVVCSPQSAYFDTRELKAHNLTETADRALAQAQHRALRERLASFGAEVIDLPELPAHPNSVFTQDTALATPEGFVRLRMGLPTRRGESEWMAEALRALGEPERGRVHPPGTAEGGDVILAEGVAFVGRSSRTNEAGARQTASLLEGMGYEVRLAPVPPPSLHIGGMMSVVSPRHVLACEGVFPAGFFHGFEVLPVPKASFISGNVITLGDGEVIAEARNVAGIATLRASGFTVHPLDLSEFVKGTGGPSCLILPLDRKGRN